MESTVVRGVDPWDLLPYEAVFNLTDGRGGVVAVDVPESVRAGFPEQGSMVSPGPGMSAVVFDAADPVAVFCWLLGATSVASVAGPDLAPALESIPDGAVA